MPPKKAESVKEKPSRREVQQKVAFERAAHFARADQLPKKRLRSAASTTPTGVIAPVSSQYNADDEIEGKQQHWPGPFSTAHDMISKREAAREARELEISNRMSGNVLKSSVEMDEYDQLLNDLKEKVASTGTSRRMTSGDLSLNSTKIPTLSTLCVRVLAVHIDCVQSLGDVPTEVKTELAAELAARRKLNASTLSLVVRGHDGTEDVSTEILQVMPTLVLPDCSGVDEEGLLNALRAASAWEGGRSSGEEYPASPLRVLELRNCGHCFTAWMSSQLNECNGMLASLEVLSLGGLYRISDKELATFMTRASNKSHLRSVSLMHSSTVGCLTMRALSTACPLLRSLSLDCCSLDQDALESLCQLLSGVKSSLKHLTELSLAGVATLSDSHIAQILIPGTLPSGQSSSSDDIPLGDRLTKLDLKDCYDLTDESLASIRSHCTVLQQLDISGWVNVTHDGLMELFKQGEAYFAPLTGTSLPLSSVGTASPLGPLRAVMISNLPAIVVTDDVVAAVCRLSEMGGGRGLHSLGIAGSAGVTGKGVMAIQKHCGPSLTSLDISFVRGVCAASLSSLVENCPRLTRLGVWGCTQLLPGRAGKRARKDGDDSAATSRGESGSVAFRDACLDRPRLSIEGYMEI